MRTTEEQVRELAGIPTSKTVSQYIEIATAITDQVAACNPLLSATILELIERNLAAHYAYVSGVKTDASVSSKSIGRASTSFSRATSSNNRSPYLETAMNLDTGRCLIGIIEGPVSIQWLGTER